MVVGCHSNSYTFKEFEHINEDSLVKINGSIDTAGFPKEIIIPKIKRGTIECCLEEIFDTIKLVRLETNNEGIVGNISSINIINDTIFILDKYTSKSLFLFSMNGQLIRKIGKLGNGPGEYIEPTSYFVDDSTIMIYDQWQHKIVRYNHEGKVLTDKKLPFICQNVMALDSGRMLCYGCNSDNHHLPQILNYYVWQCDSSFSCIDKVSFYREHDKFISMLNNNFYTYNNTNYFFDFTDNSFYEISTDGKFSPIVKLNYESKEEFLFAKGKDYLKKCMEEERAFPVTEIIAQGDYCCVSLATNRQTIFCFYNLKDNTLKYCTKPKLNETGISRVLLLNSIKTAYNDYFVYSLSPEKIFRVNEKMTSEHPELWADAPDHVREFDKKLLESLHDEDNDILVFAKIKEHFD